MGTLRGFAGLYGINDSNASTVGTETAGVYALAAAKETTESTV
jgi:hypothetical protein